MFWVESDLDERLEDDEMWRINTIDKLKNVTNVFGFPTGWIFSNHMGLSIPTLIKYRNDVRFTFDYIAEIKNLKITVIKRSMMEDGEIIDEKDLYKAIIYVDEKNEDK